MAALTAQATISSQSHSSSENDFLLRRTTSRECGVVYGGSNNYNVSVDFITKPIFDGKEQSGPSGFQTDVGGLSRNVSNNNSLQGQSGYPGLLPSSSFSPEDVSKNSMFTLEQVGWIFFSLNLSLWSG